MTLTAEWVMAICAGVTLLIYFTGTLVGAVIFLWKKIDAVMARIESVKADILADVNTKHRENHLRVDAIQALVIRHDTMLDPEFNGTGKARQTRQQ